MHKNITTCFYTLSLHPWFWGTISLMSGIATGMLCPHTNFLWLICSISVTFLAMACIRQTQRTALLLWAGLLIAFMFGNLILHNHVETHQHNAQHFHNKSWDFVATVTDINPLANKRFAYAITIATHSCAEHSAGTWQNIPATFLIYTHRRYGLQVDDTIAINNLTMGSLPHNDFARYLCKEKITAHLFAPSLDVLITKRPTYSFWRFIHVMKMHLLAGLKKAMNKTTYAFFALLFLGNKQVNTEDFMYLKDRFKIWGISHYLARSGLHMVIFVIIWQLLLKLSPLGWILQNFILLFLGIVYFLLSFSSISFLRAFGMFILCKLLLVADRPVHMLHILTLVTLCTLLCNPLQLFFLDFQLSFGLTFALAWLQQVNISQRRTLAHS